MTRGGTCNAIQCRARATKQRLTLYLARLASASAEVRSDLRVRLKSILDKLDKTRHLEHRIWP